MGKIIVAAVFAAGVVLLQNVASADAPAVGALQEVKRTVYGTPPGGGEAVKRTGDHVLFKEEIETRDRSRAHIRFMDGSDLNLGEKTKVLIDEFVFDPAKGNGNAVINLSVGTLRWVTGAMPKGGTVIKTPTATLTLRGTTVNVTVHPDGTTDTDVEDGQVDVQNNSTNQNNSIGPGQGQTSGTGGNQDFSGGGAGPGGGGGGGGDGGDTPEHRRGKDNQDSKPKDPPKDPPSPPKDDEGCEEE